jgi:hypothetical protein
MQWNTSAFGRDFMGAEDWAELSVKAIVTI